MKYKFSRVAGIMTCEAAPWDNQTIVMGRRADWGLLQHADGSVTYGPGEQWRYARHCRDGHRAQQHEMHSKRADIFLESAQVSVRLLVRDKCCSVATEYMRATLETYKALRSDKY